VRVGARLALDGFLHRLERLGYTFEPLVETVGQVARRGGIVDVYPPDAVLPVRIEFLGDRVDSLRRYHPATQRTTELITEVEVGPAREAQADPERIAALRASLDFSRVELGLRPRLEDELDALARGDSRGGLYAPFLLHATLLDHLPADTLIITDEAHDLRLLLEELDRQAAEACADLERKGQIPRGLPLPHVPAERLFAALEARRPSLDLQRWAIEQALTPGPSPSIGRGEDGSERPGSYRAPSLVSGPGPAAAGGPTAEKRPGPAARSEGDGGGPTVEGERAGVRGVEPTAPGPTTPLHDDTSSPSPSIGRGGQGVRAQPAAE